MFWLINQFGTTLISGNQQVFDSLDDGLDIVDEDLKRISQVILTYDQDRVR